MATDKKAREEKHHSQECAVCGWKPEQKRFGNPAWPEGKPIVHCEGSRLAYQCVNYEAHHTAEKHADCWRCGKPMGCPICVPADVLCRACVVWARKSDFLRHGPFSNDKISVEQRNGKVAPGAEVYPFDWRLEYKPSFPNLSDDQLRASVDSQIRHMSFQKRMPHDPPSRQLEAERNRQVAAVVAAEPIDKSDYANPTITDDDIPF